MCCISVMHTTDSPSAPQQINNLGQTLRAKYILIENKDKEKNKTHYVFTHRVTENS